MKILITGGAGYIGSKLVPALLKKNYNVTVIDNYFFNQKSLKSLNNKNLQLIEDDVRNFERHREIIKKQDFIIPLAALVGAPLCDKFPKDTKEINELYIKQLSNFVDEHVKIIMPTTNSGYGVAKKENICTENSPLNPISLYGVTKVNAEKIIMNRENSISLRLATVFGYSERMRLDLLVNTFAYKAIKDKKIEIFEGKFKRNFIYIDDVINIFIYCIENFEKLKSNIYNFGIEGANLTKIELVKVIKKFVPDFEYVINEFSDDPDKRDYIVSNKKILETGFNFSWDLESAVKQLISDLKKLPPGNYSNI
tara:strand:+ start:824 stop:1753 length:930 start_codon:yes stop_codon:yes gene_type:complete